MGRQRISGENILRFNRISFDVFKRYYYSWSRIGKMEKDFIYFVSTFISLVCILNHKQ